MKITIIGRGNVGGTLQRLLSANGHEVDALGSDGGDASGADVLILAVPGGAVEDALRGVSGVEGKILIDATNPLQGRPDGVESLSVLAKSVANGPTAKAFNANFAALFEQAGMKASGRRRRSVATTRQWPSPSSSRATAGTTRSWSAASSTPVRSWIMWVG